MKKFLLLALVALAPAFADAADKKRVIVCTVTTGFRHGSIPFAEKTLEKLGAESGVYEIIDFARQPETNVPKKPNKPNKPKEPAPDADQKAKDKYAGDLKKFESDQAKYDADMAKWTPEKEAEAKAAQAKFDGELKASLGKLDPKNLTDKKVDLVIFANTTGDLPLPDKDGFIKWIEDGHSFAAMHSGSDTFHGFKGYINMLQGEFKGHNAQVPADLVAGDTKHAANAGIGEAWNLKKEEMYLIGSQDPTKVRALWYLKHHPNNTSEVGFFPVSWCRMAGKGRVFYTSLGHREDLWSDDPNMKSRENTPEIAKQYQAHILGGIKWSLGLADGSAEPNPAVAGK